MNDATKILEVGEELQTNDNTGTYTKLRVLMSGAGYYIGRMFNNPEGYQEPGSRESGYYPTHESATEALRDKTYHRVADENDYMYKNTTPIKE